MSESPDAALQACLRGCAEGLNDALLSCVKKCYTAADWDPPVRPGTTTPLWQSLLYAALLLMLSGLFSGLTLGLMSLDTIGLQILEEAGEPDERRHAAAIMPVRKRGNLLLCTLLLGNTLVNALIAISMADLTSGVLGGIISTMLIVVLGEIVPQAACSRHGLLIGASTLWLVKFFLVLMFPIAYPISLVLDRVLGREIGTVYNPNELKKLINIHVENPDAAVESGLTAQDQRLLTGALEYKDKQVLHVMTDLDKVFMLEINARLNFSLMFLIYRSGFTRIPVYESYRTNVVGILFVKDLILVDPDDEVEIRAILAFHGDRSAGYVKCVKDETTLDRVFKYFKSSYIHLLFAYKEQERPMDEDVDGMNQDDESRQKQITGVISLEDVLEAVIQDEIIDETDNFVDVNAPTTGVVQRGKHRRDLSQFMALFEHKIRKLSSLTAAEINAIAAFLTTNVKTFAPWKDSFEGMKKLIQTSQLVEYHEEKAETEGEYPTSAQSHQGPSLLVDDDERPRIATTMGRRLFQKGQQCDMLVLVLQGKVTVSAGQEDFKSTMGPWSVLGERSLTSETSFVPDFNADVHGAGRLLLIHHVTYLNHLRMNQEKRMEDQMMSSEMSQHRRRQLQPTGSGGEGKFGKHSMQHTGGNAQDEWRKRMAEHTHTHTHNDHPTMMREESHRSDESHRKYTHTMLPTGSLGSNGKASETSDDANLSSKTQMIDNSSYNSGTHARSPHRLSEVSSGSSEGHDMEEVEFEVEISNHPQRSMPRRMAYGSLGVNF